MTIKHSDIPPEAIREFLLALAEDANLPAKQVSELMGLSEAELREGYAYILNGIKKAFTE